MNDNPYAPPRTPVSKNAVADHAIGTSDGPPESASRWLRFANFLIDQVAILAVRYILAIITVLVAGAEAIQWFMHVSGFVVGISISLLYYITCEGMTARTIGKWVTGTRVVNEVGRRPAFLQVVGRSFGRLIPFEPLSFFDAERRGWHDSVASTFVVKSRNVGQLPHRAHA